MMMMMVKLQPGSARQEMDKKDCDLLIIIEALVALLYIQGMGWIKC